MITDRAKEIGVRIKALRLSLSLGQVEFAAAIEISQATLSYVESGQVPPSAEMLIRIIERYKHIGVTYEGLLDGTRPLRRDKKISLTYDKQLLSFVEVVHGITNETGHSVEKLAEICNLPLKKFQLTMELEALPAMEELIGILIYLYSRHELSARSRQRKIQWDRMQQTEEKMADIIEQKLQKKSKLPTKNK